MNILNADLLRYLLYGALAGAAVTWIEMRARPETGDGAGMFAALAGGAVGGALLVLIGVLVRRYFIGSKR
jgi:LPXTG-motif cell wall-anchored protein